ncbi:MAG: TRAP transporter substrate-binding protein [Halanaerobiales bacterium]|nr:TRAP transporter substrate-binding protein [Halanaerobiales bacterium]
MNKWLKGLSFIIITVILVSGLVGATTLKVANYYAVDHPVNQALREEFKTIVEKETAGKIKVQIFPNNQLGDEQEFIEGVQLGTIEMAMTGNMWENTIPVFKIIQLPYVFKGYQHANAVLNGPIGAEIYQKLAPLNVKVLGSFPNGFRTISNNKRAINSLADTKGVKLRVYQGETIINLMKALGFDVVVMNMSEIFTALQQGVVDGQDNSLVTTYYAGWYDVQKHVAITNHIYGPGYLVVNSDLWQGFSVQEKEIINRAATTTMEKIMSSVIEQEADVLAKIKAKGLEVTHPDLSFFKTAAQPIMDQYLKEYPQYQDIVNQIEELSQEF